MGLSAHEQKLLEQLEKQFHEEDPNFAKAMEQDPASRWNASRLVTGAVAIVAGFLLVLLGAAPQGTVSNILIGTLGFAVMVFGGYLALPRTSVISKEAPASVTHDVKLPRKTTAAQDRHLGRDSMGDWALWTMFWWV